MNAATSESHMPSAIRHHVQNLHNKLKICSIQYVYKGGYTELMLTASDKLPHAV